MTPDLQARIADWRLRATAGTLTEAEQIEAIKTIREARMSAAQASTTAKAKKAAPPPPNADSLLDELGGME